MIPANTPIFASSMQSVENSKKNLNKQTSEPCSGSMHIINFIIIKKKTIIKCTNEMQ